MNLELLEIEELLLNHNFITIEEIKNPNLIKSEEHNVE